MSKCQIGPKAATVFHRQTKQLIAFLDNYISHEYSNEHTHTKQPYLIIVYFVPICKTPKGADMLYHNLAIIWSLNTVSQSFYNHVMCVNKWILKHKNQ